MPSKFLLRALNPQTEIDLYQQAYNWRNSKRDRMKFEDFAADTPNQIVLGLFNGELQAAYLLHEVEPNVYQCHFTSRRDAPKDAVLSAAKWIVDYFVASGLRLIALVEPRCVPLRHFSEAIGLAEVGQKEITCQTDTPSDTLAAVRTYIVYGR